MPRQMSILYQPWRSISVISLANTKFKIELFQYSISSTRWHTKRKESFFVLSSSKTTTIICSIWRKRRKINAEIEIFRFWNRLYHPSITCIHHFHYYTLHSFLLQFHQHSNRPKSLCNYLHRHHVQEDFLLRDVLNFQKKMIRSFCFRKYLIFFNVISFYKSDLINTCISLLQHQVLISYDYSEVFALDIYSWVW